MKKIPFCDKHILSFLDSYLGSKQPLDLALSRYFRANKSLGATDRKTIGNTLFEMARWDSLIHHLCPFEKDSKKRLDTYRNISWETLETDRSIPEFARFGVNEFLYLRLITVFGKEKGQELCRTFNTPAPICIRANNLKTTREKLLEQLSQTFAVSPCEKAPHGIQFQKREPLFSLPSFKEGLFEVQDEGSQLVALLVEANPGDHVLDFCSGSGGKTLAFAPRMGRKGQIFLTDIRPKALMEARQRLRRAGVENAQCIELEHLQLKRLKGKCDWVLIDVPCSGTGTLRRNPEQKTRIDQATIERLVLQQREIAAKAIPFLKPNGKLVYATCSILPEENELQVNYFLDTHPIVLEKEPFSLLPKQGGPDGFFGAVFRKKTIC